MQAIVRGSELEQYLQGQSGAADFQGPWILCRGFRLLILDVEWAAVVACAATLGVEGRTNALGPVYTIPTPTGIYGAWPTVGATADAGAVVIENPFPEMRLTAAFSSPGGANQFNAWYELRG